MAINPEDWELVTYGDLRPGDIIGINWSSDTDLEQFADEPERAYDLDIVLCKDSPGRTDLRDLNITEQEMRRRGLFNSWHAEEPPGQYIWRLKW
jgi:hypothetical protein